MWRRGWRRVWEATRGAQCRSRAFQQKVFPTLVRIEAAQRLRACAQPKSAGSAQEKIFRGLVDTEEAGSGEVVQEWEQDTADDGLLRRRSLTIIFWPHLILLAISAVSLEGTPASHRASLPPMTR